MPIAALSEIAVRAIGSSQVLTDPCSVVKELIDNALDARATSIFVDISLNSLDVIQVKDNGYGIGPEDRAMVCRRYCTSKIRNLEDLKEIGGRSLGFRGEALASAAELSRSLVVTTRIEGEPVAVSLKIDREGEIKSQEKASHPVGSTVRVVDFLKYLPVRRQTALKTAQKVLAKIKHTLQAYAIARPSIRLSLKVLKAKNEKGNWVYAPKAGASVPDAAMKVVDKTIPGQCQWISWCSSQLATPAMDTATESEDLQDKEGVDSQYRIEAFLPKPGADASIIGNAGYFISVDSRPVTCTRGLLKQLITMYKSYIRSACLMYTEKITNPFLCINIVCPRGSYDANVEPAKDDVLFVDQSRLLLILETFFGSVYGELEETSNKKVHKTKYHHGAKDQKGFDLLLARKPQGIANSVSPKSPSTDIRTIEIAGNVDHKPSTEGQLRVDADHAVGQAEAWTENHQLPTQSVTPSQFERAGRSFGDSQSPNHSPADHSAADGEHSSKGKSTWHFSMYGGDEEQVEQLDNTSTRATEDETVDGKGLQDVNVSNPWTMAKMNIFVRPGRRIEPDSAIGDIVENGQLMTPARERIGHRTSTIVPGNGLVHRKKGNDANLQTPQHTLRSPSPSPKGQSSSGAWHFPSKAWGKAQPDLQTDRTKVQALEPNGGGALDAWIQSSPNIGHSAESIDDRHSTRDLVRGDRTDWLAASQRVHATSNDFISARSLQQGTQLSDIPEAPPKRTPRLGLRKQPRLSNQQGAIDKPFVSPVNDPTKVWFEMEPQRRPRPHPRPQSQSVRNTIATTAPIRFESETEDINAETTPVNPTPPLSHPTQVDLEDLMEYEHRKSAATRAYKSSLHDQVKLGLATPNTGRVDRGRLSSGNSPHKNRYEAAKAALTPSGDNAYKPDNTPPIFADGDPRAYLIRVQNREQEAAQRDSIASGGASHKLRRAKTTMLPLETIAADRRVHNLTLNISTDVTSVKRREVEAMDTDEYVRSGEIPCGLLDTISDDEVQIREQQVSSIMKNTYRDAENGDRTEEMSFDFSPALRRHVAAHT